MAIINGSKADAGGKADIGLLYGSLTVRQEKRDLGRALCIEVRLIGVALQKVRTRNPRLRHPRLYALTWASAVLAILLTALAVGVFLKAPPVIREQPFWAPLKDIGPAIAGSFVLCAALFAITAAGITAISTAGDSEAREVGRKQAIGRVCLGEVKSFWDRCNYLQIAPKMKAHIDWLKLKGSDERNAFRRYMGDDWFSFFRVDPVALGELNEEASARYISLSANTRHVVSRLDFLNSCDFSSHNLDFWIKYHQDTYQLITELYGPTREVAALLGLSNFDPSKFRFSPTKGDEL